LQEREVVPVGGTRPTRVDLRLVTATHRDLKAQVAAGRFRADLYARINGWTLRLPPLRERMEDLGLLCAQLLARLAGGRAESLSVTPRALRALIRHPWPLNVRELERGLEAALALAGPDGVIDVDHLPEAVRAGAPVVAAAGPPEVTRERLIQLLEKHGGNLAGVARELGKARMQIHRWLKREGLDPARFRG
jgi:transcriptional regulator of acetoin/glycerol metabolism